MFANRELLMFRDFLNEKIAAGSPLGLEAALEEYFTFNEPSDARDAIRESLEENRSGTPGQCAREYLAELRKKYGFDRS